MGKAITFMLFCWLIVSIAGGVSQGSITTATSMVTVPIASANSTADITVTSTEGFPDSGIIVISNERIGYSGKTATTFTGSLTRPIIRGAQDTVAVAHTSGELARTLESSMMNSSLNYNLAVLSDSAGITAFLTIPNAILRLLGSFLVLPLNFLGTNLEILTYIWAF